MRLLWFAVVLALLAACGHVREHAPDIQPAADVPVTIATADYLAQSRKPDGNPATPQRASDPLNYRRFDLGLHIQASDTVAADDGRSFITTWDYPPYGGHFDASTGDGGEVYVVENGVARISETQDGSKPGITYFVAKGGTGWLLFDNKAPTGSWRCETARLRAASSPDADVKLGPAYTCWRHELLTLPFVINGSPSAMQVEAIISEHHDGQPDRTRTIERFVMGRGWGRLVWEYWAVSGTPPSNLSQRCPGIGIPDPSGMVRMDCRYSTMIEAKNGAASVAAFAWPGR
jgi:hypothetical protein